MTIEDTPTRCLHLQALEPRLSTPSSALGLGGSVILTMSIFLAACGSDASSADGDSSASSEDGTASSTTIGTTGPAATTSAASTVTSGGAANSTTGNASAGSSSAFTGSASSSAVTSGGITTGSSADASSTSNASSTTGETTAAATTTTGSGDCTDTGASESFSFFVTSYQQIIDLSGSEDGFGGDLRYNGAATGLDGADAICQEMARRVCFGHRTWRAYLSTSTENAIDRIGGGPWYDYSGALVSNDIAGLLTGDRPAGGAIDSGTYDELGIFHDGSTDVNDDGRPDDDHDTMTATLADGTYAGFSCDDWTSTTATDTSVSQQQGPGGAGGPGGPGLSGGIMLGHSWPAMSGQHWSESHGGHQCAAGVNFLQDGGGDSSTVGGGGGYGGFFCFALAQ